ncbi:MAG: signal peptidase II [Pseudomonadota bacterium]
MTRNLSVILMLFLFSFVLDQGSKLYVTDVLQLSFTNREYDVFPPFLRFVYAENCGINFGLFSNCSPESAYALVALSVAISAALLVWALRRGTGALAFGAGLVIGGALANAWDRLTHGAVIDFLNMSCCGIHNPFSFNIADIAIFGGAIWIAFRA